MVLTTGEETLKSGGFDPGFSQLSRCFGGWSESFDSVGACLRAFTNAQAQVGIVGSSLRSKQLETLGGGLERSIS